MTFRNWIGFALVLVFEVPLTAGSPIGWITASQPIRISNLSIPGEAGPAPLAAGDELVADSGRAFLILPGLGNLVLEKGSTLKIEQDDEFLSVRLVEGSLFYDLKPNAKIAVFAGSRQISLEEKRSGKAQSADGPEESDPSFPPRVRTEPIRDPRFRPPSPSQP